MEFTDLVARRRMTRRFRAEPSVPDDVIEALVALAGRAPSAGFSQGWEYVVLRTPGERERFWDAAGPHPATTARVDAPAESAARWLAGVRRAPVLLLALADEGAYRARYAAPDKGSLAPAEQSWPVPYWLTDTAMGVLLILLGARDRGLGALFFGVPQAGHGPVKAAFGIPAGLALVGIVAIGHEERVVGGSSSVRPRRPVAQFAHWGAFGAPRPGGQERVSENAGQTGPSGDGAPEDVDSGRAGTGTAYGAARRAGE